MGIRTGRFRFGPDNGRMVLRISRTGLASAVGHDLTLEVTDWSAEIDVSETGLADSTATARIELGSLGLRDGNGRASALTEKERGEIADNARRTLDVDRHPTATFESTGVVTGDDAIRLTGRLTLHGVTAPVDVEVREVAPDRFSATAVVTQTAFGIKPYSAMLGALKVRDDIEMETEVHLEG